LRRHIGALEQSTAARQAADPAAGKRRRYKKFLDAAASWSRVERIIARAEAGPQGTNTRFVVTNLTSGSAGIVTLMTGRRNDLGETTWPMDVLDTYSNQRTMAARECVAWVGLAV
jgi:hypothetical protein